MRRTILTIISFASTCCMLPAQTDNEIIQSINRYGTFDNWTVREIKESGIIGGRTKYLYEFYGQPTDTLRGNMAFYAPKGYYWRTNNVMANVMGVVKCSITDFPEKRGEGWCLRIETHTEKVKALGIVNMEVTCQGAFLLGKLDEPIRDTKNPMTKPEYGMEFHSRPKALIFDYKCDVGHEVIRGTGFSALKPMGIKDYPQATLLLQKRWEDEDGKIHALRVGTGIKVFYQNEKDWVNGYRQEIHYGDISKEPWFEPEMDIISGTKTMYAKNSRGKKVVVTEEGWADADETPNYMIISFISSIGDAFYGGVGNTLWLDNVKLEM